MAKSVSCTFYQVDLIIIRGEEINLTDQQFEVYIENSICRVKPSDELITTLTKEIIIEEVSEAEVQKNEKTAN